MIAIWANLDGMTHNHHDEGGAVVLADSIERAVVLLREQAAFLRLTDQELIDSADILHGPGGSGGRERVVVFPNAGCY